MTENDLCRVRTLAGEFGWNLGLDWLTVLRAHDPCGCYVVRAGCELAGVVMTARYAESAWIGNLMVSPTLGRLGLGTCLLEHALGILDHLGIRTVHLDADAPGIRIYQRHGFLPRFQSRRFRGTAACDPARRGRSVLMVANDWPDVASLDLVAFGDDRHRLLELLVSRAEAAFCLRDRSDRVAGYAVLVHQADGLQLGPWVAADPDTAQALLDAALAHAAGQVVSVGVEEPNEASAQMLLARGFSEMPASLRMTRGNQDDHGRSACVWGIGSGASG